MINSKIAKINKLKAELNDEIRQVESVLDLIGIKTVNDSIFSFNYLFSYYEHDENHFFEREKTTLELLQYQINDLDWPVSQANGKKICELFALNENDTKEFLNYCSTDEQYQNYLETERRLYCD